MTEYQNPSPARKVHLAVPHRHRGRVKTICGAVAHRQTIDRWQRLVFATNIPDEVTCLRCRATRSYAHAAILAGPLLVEDVEQ
jgi:hypothetical protein